MIKIDNKTESILVQVTPKMKEELKKTVKNTGLSQSEITRRGLLNQIKELEDVV